MKQNPKKPRRLFLKLALLSPLAFLFRIRLQNPFQNLDGFALMNEAYGHTSSLSSPIDFSWSTAEDRLNKAKQRCATACSGLGTHSNRQAQCPDQFDHLPGHYEYFTHVNPKNRPPTFSADGVTSWTCYCGHKTTYLSCSIHD